MATIIKGKNANKPWTVRYYYEGRQREKSFSTAREARDFKAKFENDSRERIFVDPKTANQKFEDVANEWLARHPGSAKTLSNYEMALRLHVLPEFGSRGLAAVAADRDGVERFLRETLPGKGLGVSMRRTCYMVISAIVNDAIKTGKLNQTRLRGLSLPASPQRAEILFASHRDIRRLASEMPEPYGFSIYLMRGCGLRLGEALGWEWDDFLEAQDRADFEGATLRLKCQQNPAGTGYAPLKHRGAEDYRDIPVPQYVLDARPGGLGRFPPVSHRQYREWFNRARDAAGLPRTFTPHTLRHIFASICLARGVPITDVSKWLGHQNIQVTFGIYGHLAPKSLRQGSHVLDEEWRDGA